MLVHIQASVHIEYWQAWKLHAKTSGTAARRRLESWTSTEGELQLLSCIGYFPHHHDKICDRSNLREGFILSQNLEGPIHRNTGRYRGWTSTVNGNGGESLQNICLCLDGRKIRELKPQLGPKPCPSPQRSCNLPRQHHQMAPKDSNKYRNQWGAFPRRQHLVVCWWM